MRTYTPAYISRTLPIERQYPGPFSCNIALRIPETRVSTVLQCIDLFMLINTLSQLFFRSTRCPPRGFPASYFRLPILQLALALNGSAP